MMKFSELAGLYEEIEKTSSYNKMRELLSGFLKKVPKEEMKVIAYLTLGQIAAGFDDVNTGMAEKMVIKSIAIAGNEREQKVIEKYKKTGDAGKTAEEYAGKGGISAKELFETLHKTAKITGSGSQERKTSLLAGLLSRTTPLEARYLVRIVLGQLRLGVGEKTLLDALAMAYTGKKRKEIEQAYNTCSDIGLIAETIAKKGLKGIQKIGIKVGIPVQSMLCQRIKKIEEIRKRTGYPVAVEEKYDGERIQVHKQGSRITLYSRRLENITAQFPDIARAIMKSVRAKICILDSEAMAVDAKGSLLPFQILMRRKRKYEVERFSAKIPVAIFVFDILYLNGKSLMNDSYEKRYDILKKNLKETKEVAFALRRICKELDCVEEIFNRTVENGGEGIVIKNIKGKYEAGKRGWNWIKWKPEYAKGTRDTFDLVIIGAYYGKGRRSGYYGALLCAVYNKKMDKFETFCKLGTGFTDKMLEELSKKLKKINHKPARVEVSKSMTPDIWTEPLAVAEVCGAGITKSPSHTSGRALRFPRFIRWREKKPEQATTKEEII